MTTVPETRYAKTSDGVSVAYQTSGSGPIDVVIVLGSYSHLEHAWTEPSVARFLHRIGSFARVITLDKRGVGLSDRAVGPATIEERMDDVRAVMDAAGSERAAIFGHSEGGPLACVFAATYPGRTVALLLYGAVVKWVSSEDFPWAHSPKVLEWAIKEAEDHFGQGLPLDLWAPSVAEDPLVRRWWAEHQRLSSSPGSARAMMEVNWATDIRAVLPAISVPSLVLHRRDDVIVNVEQGRYLAGAIPGARYVEFPGRDHLPFYGDAAALVDEVAQFLTGERQDRVVDRVLATVLFTDIVGSTQHATRLGDRRWCDLLSQHNGIVRAELEKFCGREVHTLGDGFLATFDGPARAIRCAAAIRDAVMPLGIEVRAGLHTGEVEVIGDDVGGIAVHIGARVGVAAQANEILVSRTVVDLVAGSGTVFEDRGAHALKGLPDDWRLFAVTAV